MAFLVEHRDVGKVSHNNASAVEQRPVPERTKSSGTMKITSAFRRSSTTASGGRSPSGSRRTSVAEPERRSSLTTLPAILRRRKINTTISELSEEDEQAATLLGHLFFNLPSEILTTVISYLDIYDIYHLREVSHSTSSILDHNASTVTRLMLSNILPEECLQHVYILYPIPSPCLSTAHLLRVSHRQGTIHKIIYNTLSFIQMRIYMLTPQSHNAASHFSPNRQKLVYALQRPAWTVYHFIESFRKILIDDHNSNHDREVGKFWACHRCKSAAKDLVNSYPKEEVIGAYHFYQLLLTHLRAATRAPTYAGTIERKLRGWGKNPANDEELSVLVVLGGMEVVSKISMMQGSYDTRLKTIASFTEKIKYHVDVNTHLKKPEQLMELEHERELTASLSPQYQRIRQDHLDRIPGLSDFFFPVWEERIQKEGLVEDESELADPFSWIQKLLYGDEPGSSDTQEPGSFSTLSALQPMPIYGAPPV